MHIYILDDAFCPTEILDTYASFIWTERYQDCGDFELQLPAAQGLLPAIFSGKYLMRNDRAALMFIEDVDLTRDDEGGMSLKITGRDLKSILYRRVIWQHTTLSGNFQNGIAKLLHENVISPTDPARKIPNFRFQQSADPAIASLTVDAQFLGETLFEAVMSLCVERDIGFRILPEGTGGFVFELYAGIDRSFAQSNIPPVVFSPVFDNLLSSNYYRSNRSYSNAVRIAGEGEGADRFLAEYAGSESGLERREIFEDASMISKTGYTDTGESVIISDEEYTKQLVQKGREALAEAAVTELFDGELSPTEQYVYGRDFDIGDIVQVANEYGLESVSRVAEVILSSDDTGEQIIPTFEKVGD